MMNLINPPAIVREENEDNTKDIYYWHEIGIKADQSRSLSNLTHAEALYHIDDLKGFKTLGYDSMNEYVFKVYNRSASWSKKLIEIHRKLVVDLGISNDKLLKATFGKISKIISHINKDNVDQILDKLPSLTQEQVNDLVKELKGEEPDAEKEEGTIRLKGPLLIIESVQTAIDMAKIEISKVSGHYKDETAVPPLLAMELVCAQYMSGCSLDGNPLESLENSLKALEHVYNVKISYENKE